MEFGPRESPSRPNIAPFGRGNCGWLRSRYSKLMAWPPARASRYWSPALSSRQPVGPRREGRTRAAVKRHRAPLSQRGRGRVGPGKRLSRFQRPAARSRLPAASSSRGSQEEGRLRNRCPAGAAAPPASSRRSLKNAFPPRRAHFRPAFPGALVQSFSLLGVQCPSWRTLRSASHSFPKVYNVPVNLPRCTQLSEPGCTHHLLRKYWYGGQSVHCPTCRVAMTVDYALLEEARTIMSVPWEESVFEFWVPWLLLLQAVSRFKRWVSLIHCWWIKWDKKHTNPLAYGA